MKEIVSLKEVKKTFKNKNAVDSVSFSIKKGEIVAILGPNGAGKTTTILMMLGLLEPTSGKVQLFGHNPKEKEIREKIGAMLQEVSVIDRLKVSEVIQLFRSYYPKPMDYDELVSLTGFTPDELKKRADKLSGGQTRRLGFALALAGDQDLLFFDEPTVGMDIQSRKLFWQTVRTLKERGKTIVFTTHYLQEADDIAERIILFHQGKIVADGTPVDIKSKLSKQYVSFIPSEEMSIDELENFPSVEKVYKENGRVYVITNETDLVLSLLFEKKYKITQIKVEEGRLDEAFEQLTVNVKEAI
ncbi:ABC transporter ATP-binding protein [Bacillus sp. 31A1R]|uniref:ABC transporter ATP-binding protein n=1 Tax=Robertmurraya mangrovi TaxID=3098077 RepID=A0ABU5J2L0_9BACI|nr:ABC transporter ATP-binding protein [Bacillus sp. 31A1R]MDZ5473587.1 ABC transporter ATP-binding protein [Bacillus sp. 31A1R]